MPGEALLMVTGGYRPIRETTGITGDLPTCLAVYDLVNPEVLETEE